MVKKFSFQTAQAVFPGGVNSPVRAFTGMGIDPPVLARGTGAYVYDTDKKKYLDFVLSWGPLIAGHAHPAVVAALQDQVTRGTSFGALSQPEIELGQFIIKRWPGLERLRFVNSGTEATMSAIRLARAATGSDGLIKFAGCYHGHADYLLVQAGSGAMTLGVPSSPGVPWDFAKHTHVAAFNDCASVEAIFKQHPGQIAALIVEPVPGNMGLIWPKDGFLASLKVLCRQQGALLIFDEVMSGFRLAFGGAQELFGVTPDLLCLGKVIGGGLPVGAYGGRAELMEKIAPAGPVYQAGTLSGNPLAMACGLATLKLCAARGFYASLNAKTQFVVAGLNAAARKAGIPFWARGQGGMFGFGFLDHEPVDYMDVKKSDTVLFKRFFVALLQRGYWLPPSTFEAAFMSGVHTQKDLKGFLDAAADVLVKL